MSTLVYYDDIFTQHQTGHHPECPERLQRVWQHLSQSELLKGCQRPSWKPASAIELTRIHSPDYIAELQAYASQGGGRIEADTVVCPASYSVALHAAGAACDAVRRVTTGEARRALCLLRPPGHHARMKSAMGFCLLNNVAIASRMATVGLALARTLIVDWDVHHGNGTQESFWEDERTAFFSIHRWPFYPGTGTANETGSGAGLGFTRNLPIEFGMARDVYLARFERELNEFANRVKPDLVLISAGFDAHRQDPIGSLSLETEDFARLTQIVCEVADIHCEGRCVSLLEGGYNIDVLPLCVEQHLRTLMPK